MGMNDSKKIDLICKFVYDKFRPYIDKAVTDDDLEVIMQNITNFFKDRKGLDELDVEDNYELLKMVTNGGIVYKANDRTYFEEENEAFMHSVLGGMSFKCVKNGIDMGDYSLGNSSVLYKDAEEKVNEEYDEEDFLMFLKGDKEGFFNKHSNELGIIQEEQPSLAEQKVDLLNQKKEVAASIRDQIKNSTIDEIRAKKTL